MSSQRKSSEAQTEHAWAPPKANRDNTYPYLNLTTGNAMPIFTHTHTHTFHSEILQGAASGAPFIFLGLDSRSSCSRLGLESKPKRNPRPSCGKLPRGVWGNCSESSGSVYPPAARPRGGKAGPGKREVHQAGEAKAAQHAA